MIKRLLYVVVMAAVVAWLYLSNNIVSMMYGDSFEKVNQSISQMKDRNVRYAIDSLSSEDQSIYECVTFVGWAYFADNQVNEKHNAGIALENREGEVYLFDAPPNFMRADFTVVTGDNGVHGFEYVISTIALPSDIYNVYVYCIDENKKQGIASTNYVLEKNGRNTSLHAWQANEVEEIDLSSVNDTAKIAMDSVDINEDGSEKLQGWAYVPEHEAGKQDVLILLIYEDGSMAAYDTKKESRPDIVETFDSELYYMAGFSTQISAELLKSNKFTPVILVRDSDGLHTSPDMLAAIQAGLSAASI